MIVSRKRHSWLFEQLRRPALTSFTSLWSAFLPIFSHSVILFFLQFLLFTSFCFFFLVLWCALCACAYNAKYHRDAIHLIRLFIIPSSVYLFFNLECFTSMGPTTGLNEKLSAQNINFNYNIFVFFFIHHLYLVCINVERKKEREREKEWEL